MSLIIMSLKKLEEDIEMIDEEELFAPIYLESNPFQANTPQNTLIYGDSAMAPIDPKVRFS